MNVDASSLNHNLRRWVPICAYTWNVESYIRSHTQETIGVVINIWEDILEYQKIFSHYIFFLRFFLSRILVYLLVYWKILPQYTDD